MKKTNHQENSPPSKGPFFAEHTIYPKLTVNQPNDRFEQEADAMADQVVMRMEEEEEQILTKPLAEGIQRECADCEGEGAAQRMPLMRKTENGGMEASPELADNIRSSKGGGSTLPSATQQRMGQAFGTDFSNVRVHTGSRATAMSNGIQAKAFTHGSDIYFNQGQYQPGSSGGDHLLAHELTHVVQQGGAPKQVQRSLLGGLVGGLAGGLVGAGIGGVIGHVAGGATGALIGGLIGAGVGAIAGGLIGHAASGNDEPAPLRRPDRPLPQSLSDLRSGNTPLLSEREIENTREYREYMRAGTVWQTQWHMTAGEARLACLLLLQDMRTNTSLNWSAAVAQQYALAAKARMAGSDMNRAQTQLAQEIEVTSLQGANRIFNEMKNLTFLNAQDQATPVPFHYPPDGCYARAELMAARLTALGYASRRQFAMSRRPGLAVVSDYSVDTASAGQTPTTRWRYHVAPIIKVEQANQDIIEMVIDPSIASGPLSVPDWIALMSSDTFTVRSLDEVRSRVGSGSGHEDNTTFSTSRASVGPNDLDQQSRLKTDQQRIDDARATLSNYANYAPAHELAQIIRTEMRGSTINVARILAHIQSMATVSRTYFKDHFPNLRSSLNSRLNASQRTTVDAALNSP